MRTYKTAKGIWGIGIGKSSEGWSLQIAKWVFVIFGSKDEQ